MHVRSRPQPSSCCDDLQSSVQVSSGTVHPLGIVLLLQVYFSNNDFLGVRVVFFGIRVILRGEVRVLWQEKGFGEMV